MEKVTMIKNIPDIIILFHRIGDDLSSGQYL